MKESNMLACLFQKGNTVEKNCLTVLLFMTLEGHYNVLLKKIHK